MRSSKKLLKMFHQILRKYRWFIDIFFTAKNMDIFENAVTSYIPEALIGVLTKFGNDQKDKIFKIMEKK